MLLQIRESRANEQSSDEMRLQQREMRRSNPTTLLPQSEQYREEGRGGGFPYSFPIRRLSEGQGTTAAMPGPHSSISAGPSHADPSSVINHHRHSIDGHRRLDTVLRYLTFVIYVSIIIFSFLELATSCTVSIRTAELMQQRDASVAL